MAAEAEIAWQTPGRWCARWRQEGEAGLEDRSSRPHQTDADVEARVVALRRERKVGPVQLAGLLAEQGLRLPASTVYRILVRHGTAAEVEAQRQATLDTAYAAHPRAVQQPPNGSTATARRRLDQPALT